MLKGLARWLRAAGYDAAQAPARSGDRVLVQQACSERRWLLSRDCKLLEIRDAARCVRLLPGASMMEWVCALNSWFELDWQRRAFSRCLRCNAPLTDADPALRGQMPVGSRSLPGPLRWCSHCRQLYWEGSHVRRMRSRLAQWNLLCRGEASERGWRHAARP